MRVYYQRARGTISWHRLDQTSNTELGEVLESLRDGRMYSAPDSPNMGVSDEDMADQIRIILFAREMGWL